jgi:hypothetical protein
MAIKEEDIQWDEPVTTDDEIVWDAPVASEDNIEWDAPETEETGLLSIPKGIAETPLALGTGMAGFVGGTARTLGDIAGQAVYSDEPIDIGAARQEGQKFAEKISYRPRTKTGRVATEAITWPFMQAIERGGPGAQETLGQIKRIFTDTKAFGGDWGIGKDLIVEAIEANLQGDFTKHSDLVSSLDLSKSKEHELGKLMTELGMIITPIAKRGGKAISKSIEAELGAAQKAVIRTPEMVSKKRVAPTADIGAPEPPKSYSVQIKAPEIAVKQAPKPPENPKYAGSINLERMSIDQSAKDVLNQAYEQNKGLINENRRGVITEAETQKLANEMGLTPEQLLKRQKGEAWNAEKALAARQILASSAERLAKLQKAVRENNSDKNLFNLREAVEQHAEIQAQVSGIASEAGRSLRQFRMEAGPEAGYKAALDALGGREMSEAIAERFANIDFSNPVEVNKFIRDVTKATTTDMVFEVWVNSLLSAPATHVVNITSNALTFLTKFPEIAAAAGIEAGRAAMTKTPRGIFFGEVPYQAYGIFEGLRSGVRKGLWAFENEMATGGVSKIESHAMTSIPTKKINILGKDIKLGGRQVRLPGRALLMMDEFFKALNYETAKHGLSLRKANMEGLKGEAKTNRIAELIQEPTLEMNKAARQDMLYRVFQKELGTTGKAVQQIRYKHPLLRIVFPFLRTPVNIAKYGLERTPLNYARIANLVRKGELKKGALSEELARATVGSLIQASLFMSSLEGTLTGGGPDDRNERDLLYRTGWQPYSVRVGDTYYSYSRFEPVGMVVGLAADAKEIWGELNEEERDDVATMIVRATARNLSSKTFLKGLNDLMGAMFNPERHLNTWTERLAGSVVPSGVAAVERAIDPELRDAQTVMGVLKGRVPGLSKDLPTRLDLWGNEISHEGNVVSRLISPVYTSKVKGNVIDREMQRLNLYIGMPSRTLGDKKLPPKLYYEYTKRAGQYAKKALIKEINRPSWKRKSDEAKKATIRTHIGAWRNKAKQEVLGVEFNEGAE